MKKTCYKATNPSIAIHTVNAGTLLVFVQYASQKISVNFEIPHNHFTGLASLKRSLILLLVTISVLVVNGKTYRPRLKQRLKLSTNLLKCTRSIKEVAHFQVTLKNLNRSLITLDTRIDWKIHAYPPRIHTWKIPILSCNLQGQKHPSLSHINPGSDKINLGYEMERYFYET